MELRERLMDKVQMEPNSGCWLWDGGLNNRGYGTLRPTGGKNIGVHRLSYQLHVAPIPECMEIDHLCKVRCCVNPDHLEPVTRLENVRRSSAGYYARSPENNVQKAKTHCPQGHPYSGDNLWTSKTGQRQCKTCHRVRERVRAAERRAKGRA